MLQVKLFGMFMMNYIMAVLFDTDWKAEIFKRLDALSEKLGVAAGHLWQVLVRQGMAEAVGSLVLAVIALIGLVTAVKVLNWARTQGEAKRPKTGRDEWPGQYIFWAVISGVGGVFTAISLCVNLYDFTLWAMNPEYFALQKILELFGK